MKLGIIKAFYKILLFFVSLFPVTHLRRKYRKSIKNRLIYCNIPSPEAISQIEIMSMSETLDYIVKNKCNVSRFGDGEIAYSLSPDFKHNFQPYNKGLYDKLRTISTHPLKNCLLCMPSWISKTQNYSDYDIMCLSEYWNAYRPFLLDKSAYKYGESYCFFETSFSEGNLEKIKQCWAGMDVIIVTGKGSTFLYDSRLFDCAKSLDFIYSKSVDAFSEYDLIINKIRQHNKNNTIFLLSLGLTATALAYDLAKENIRALDIGHITNYFLTSLNEMPNIEKLRMSGKYIDGQTDIAALKNELNSGVKNHEK